MKIAENVMNPVRQRIFQYLLVHETGTVKEIRKALPDVPSASLYRHMKILTEASILSVVGENRIRGTVESIYQLNKSALEIDDANGIAVQTALLGICASFAKYFSGDSPDPRQDMLMMTTCTLTLTDGGFIYFGIRLLVLIWQTGFCLKNNLYRLSNTRYIPAPNAAMLL